MGSLADQTHLNRSRYEVTGPSQNGYAVLNTTTAEYEYDGVATKDEAQHLADMLNRGQDPRDDLYKA